MSTLGDWTYRQLLGDDARPGGGWLDWIVEARDRAGSGRALANAMGVNESVVRRMLSGKTRQPKAGTLTKLREYRLSARARDDAAVVMHTTDRDSGRTRVLDADNLRLTPGTMDRVAAAWVATGDQEAAGAAFLAGVSDPWYRAYLTPRAAVEAVAPAGPDGPGEFDEVYEDEDGELYVPAHMDELEDWPYDDMAGEEIFGPDADSYGGDVA